MLKTRKTEIMNGMLPGTPPTDLPRICSCPSSCDIQGQGNCAGPLGAEAGPPGAGLVVVEEASCQP